MTRTDRDTGEFKPKKQTKLIRKVKQKVTTYLAKNESGEDREIVETEFELYSAHEAARDVLKYRGKLVDKTDVNFTGSFQVNWDEPTDDD